MIFSAIAAALLILNSVSVLPMAVAKQDATQLRSQPNLISAEYESTLILGRVRSVLSATGYTGILAYSGVCQKANGLPFVAFPKVDMHRTESNMALQAMHQIFRGNASVTIEEERHKMISITIGAPLTAVLKTRISLLRLTPLAQYNPFLAIGAVEDAEKVKAEMSRLKLHTPPFFFEELLAKPSKGLPHLPHISKNVSVKRVLTSIATMFNGMIVYGTCTRPNGGGVLQIYFMGLDNSVD